MGDILSLSRTRKAKSKADAASRAAENRIRFGRTKSEKAADAREAEAHKRRLDGLERRDSTEDPT
ncbi:MAG: DUF4169 family protein [Ancalomicrobiaceae bacterium]|nr:DUF4169 family protein [Ancalomicrobiaceae bacterium]